MPERDGPGGEAIVDAGRDHDGHAVIKTAPSWALAAAGVAFAASCVGLLLFLWSTFGGAIPLKAKGYRMHVSLPDAQQLTTHADVRISGVSVGKVIRHRAIERTGRTDVEIELESRFAPRPRDTRAIVRQKTLLGETYIELSPGNRSSAPVPDGGWLAPGRVSRAVTINDVYRTFDPLTRSNFSRWLTGQGAVLDGSGTALNRALAALEPFVGQADAVTTVIDGEREATAGFLRNAGRTFSQIARRPEALAGLVRDGNAAFAATAAQQSGVAATVKAFAPFAREARLTLDELGRFARSTTPTTDALRPGVSALSRVLRHIPTAARPLQSLLAAAPSLERASREGAPAVGRLLPRAAALLGRLRPFLGQINPSLRYASAYRRELAAALANTAAATQSRLPAAAGGQPLHLMRAVVTFNPASLAAFPRRLTTDRANPYPAPGAFDRLRSGLEAFPQGCGSAPLPALADSIPPDLRNVVRRFFYTEAPANVGCREQAPLAPQLTGAPGAFPRVTPEP